MQEPYTTALLVMVAVLLSWAPFTDMVNFDPNMHMIK